MTSKDIVPAILRPVTVVIEPSDYDDYYTYITDANGLELCGFGDASDENKTQAHEVADAINSHAALIAALAAIQEAGRMSDQPRAKYCAQIAGTALASLVVAVPGGREIL